MAGGMLIGRPAHTNRPHRDRGTKQYTILPLIRSDEIIINYSLLTEPTELQRYIRRRKLNRKSKKILILLAFALEVNGERCRLVIGNLMMKNIIIIY